MLISETYRDLNKKLHADNKAYGYSGLNWAGAVFYIRQGRGKDSTVLDYGCGKGSLGDVYGRPPWFFEYDPAIPGKDKPPEGKYDIVVCTDVMEHIEPDYVDNVIAHIDSLTKQCVLFFISVLPAKKFLDDGRNAHINLHDGEWWRAKLQERFSLTDFQCDGGHVYALCEKMLEVPEQLNTKSAVSLEIRYDQYKINSKRVTKRLFPYAGFGYANERPVVLACYGPSLRDTWEEIKAQKEAGGFLVTVSGAHDFLIEKGIIPDVHIEVDPRAHKAFFTSNPHRDVKYWIASCCHPTLIDQLLNYDLSLWHVLNNDDYDRKIFDDEPDQPLIGGKGTVGLRAMSVLFALGYRRFLIHGMDCSHDAEGQRHAGEHSGKIQKCHDVRCNGRIFKSNLGMIVAARSLIKLVPELDEFAKTHLGEEPKYNGQCVEIILHGDGLQQEMVKAGQANLMAA